METSWDEDLLPLELAELADLDFDLALTGFEPDELAAFLAEETEGLTDPDDVPEIPEEPVSKTGDLYLLGNHRLLCGDATNADDVKRLMDGKRATLMATDPPYLVDYTGGNHPQSYNAKGEKRTDGQSTKHWDTYTDPDQATDFFADFLRTAFALALTPDAAVYQCFASMRSDLVMAAWRAVGLLPHQIVVWKKSRPVLTRCWFMWDWEPLMVGWMKGNQPKMKPPNNERGVWEIASLEGVEDGVAGTHPTIKPVELIRRPITWQPSPAASSTNRSRVRARPSSPPSRPAGSATPSSRARPSSTSRSSAGSASRAGRPRWSAMGAPKTNQAAIAARVAQILPLVTDGASEREILRFIAEKTSWAQRQQAHRRELHRPGPRADHRELGKRGRLARSQGAGALRAPLLAGLGQGRPRSVPPGRGGDRAPARRGGARTLRSRVVPTRARSSTRSTSPCSATRSSRSSMPSVPSWLPSRAAIAGERARRSARRSCRDHRRP